MWSLIKKKPNLAEHPRPRRGGRSCRARAHARAGVARAAMAAPPLVEGSPGPPHPHLRVRRDNPDRISRSRQARNPPAPESISAPWPPRRRAPPHAPAVTLHDDSPPASQRADSPLPSASTHKHSRRQPSSKLHLYHNCDCW
jgi:hypothetical protein